MKSKCTRPEDSDCLRVTRTRAAYPLPGAQETSRDNCGERPRWVVSGPSPRHIKVKQLRRFRTFSRCSRTGRLIAILILVFQILQ